MTHDKVRQDFEAAYSSGDTICDAMSLARREDGEYEQALARLCYKWFFKGRAAERAEICEKLESEGVAGDVAAEIWNNSTPSDITLEAVEACMKNAAKAAITKILEVI